MGLPSTCAFRHGLLRSGSPSRWPISDPPPPWFANAPAPRPPYPFGKHFLVTWTTSWPTNPNRLGSYLSCRVVAIHGACPLLVARPSRVGMWQRHHILPRLRRIFRPIRMSAISLGSWTTLNRNTLQRKRHVSMPSQRARPFLGTKR